MGYSAEAIRKGIIAEHLAKVFFLKKGFSVLVPESHDSHYDFVISDDEEFKRVQVKAANIDRIYVRFRNKRGSKNTQYNVSDYDILAGVWVEQSKIFLYESSLVNNRESGETIYAYHLDNTPLKTKTSYQPYFIGEI